MLMPFNKRLSWLGPGLVYVLTVMGAGDIVSNSAAGADYQYALIWALGVTLIFRYIWVGASAKYVLVTGETLLQGYGRLGNWLIWIVLAALLVFRHFYNLYLIVLLGTTWDLLFHLPTNWSSAIWSVFFSGAGFVMMVWGGYPILEYFCKVLVAAKGISLIIAAVLSHPDPAGILKGAFVPTIPGSTGFYSSLLVLMALIGTEAGSMTNLTYPYFMFEKGWRDVSYIKQQRFDLGFGVACIFVMGALLQIAAAGTVHPLGVKLEGPEQLVQIFSQSLGLAGLLIFALGLWGAAFSTYVGATTGYALIMTDLCRRYIPRLKKPIDGESKRANTKNDPIYRWSIVFWSFSPLYILLVQARPVWLVLTVSSMVVVVIPALALPLLRLTNDRKLMGKYTNGWFTNIVLMMLIVVSLYFTYKNGLGVWQQLRPILH
jgi:Mn2+/Fe2+ NRAMP family transporter